MGNDATDDSAAGRSNPAKPETTGASRREPPVIEVKAQDISAPAGPARGAPETARSTPGAGAADKPASDPKPAASPIAEPQKSSTAASKGAAEPGPPQPTPPQPARSGGGWRTAAAVLLTLALVGAGAAGAWHWRGPDPALAETQKAVAALQARLDAFDGKLAAAPGALAALDKRVAAVEATVKAADAAAQSATTTSDAARVAAEGARASAEAALANAARALDAPKRTEAAAPAPPAAPAPVAAFDPGPLEQRLTAIETRPAPDLAPLEQRLAVIENKAPVDLAPISQRIAGVEALGPRVAALEKRVPALEATLSQPKTDQRALETREPGLPSLEQGAAAVAVAENMTRAVERGAPFAAELAALRRLGARSEKLNALDAFAAKGAPSLAALNDSFRAARPAVLAALKPRPASTADAAAPAPADAGYWQKLTQGVSAFVRVRKAGEPAAPAPESVIAPFESSLARGDVDAALGLWDKLPEAARAASKDWGAAARSRVEITRNAQAALAETIAALNTPK
jgi:hypothetical protein